MFADGRHRPLLSKDAVCKYLEIDKNKFYRLIEQGMPAVKTATGWVSHTRALDEYFYQLATTEVEHAGNGS